MNDYKELIGELKEKCPDRDYGYCELAFRASDAIEQLVKERNDNKEKSAQWRRDYLFLMELNEELYKELGKVRKERDAAVTAINTIRYAFIEHDSNAGCCGCKNNTFGHDKSVCAGCTLNDNWEWRGVQEDNDEID